MQAVVIAKLPNNEIAVFGPFEDMDKAKEYAKSKFILGDSYQLEYVFSPSILMNKN